MLLPLTANELEQVRVDTVEGWFYNVGLYSGITLVGYSGITLAGVVFIALVGRVVFIDIRMSATAPIYSTTYYVVHPSTVLSDILTLLQSHKIPF